MLSISTGSSDGDGSSGSGNKTWATGLEGVLANHYITMAHRSKIVKPNMNDKLIVYRKVD